jgi:small subunit ribosomal protein S14
MKSLIEKDKKRRYLYSLYEKKYWILKYIHSNRNLSYNIRREAYLQLNKFPRSSSLVRLRTRCVLTNRGRSVYKKFKLSRLKLRTLALKGELPGIKKISW